MELTFDNPPTPVTNSGLVRFAGDQLELNIPPGRPYKLIYGRSHAAQETQFVPLPPRPPLTYPLDQVLERQGADARPEWILLKTRKQMTLPEGVTLCVGCSSVWPSKEQATEHAAAIVSKKIAWFVRQNYVNRSRQYERKCNASIASLGYDNWNLGYEAAVKVYTRESLEANAGAKWYWEKVAAGTESGNRLEGVRGAAANSSGWTGSLPPGRQGPVAAVRGAVAAEPVPGPQTPVGIEYKGLRDARERGTCQQTDAHQAAGVMLVSRGPPREVPCP